MSLLAFPGQHVLYLPIGLVCTCFFHRHFAILILEQTICLKIKLKLQKNSLKENMIGQHSTHLVFNLNFRSVFEAMLQACDREFTTEPI